MTTPFPPSGLDTTMPLPSRSIDGPASGPRPVAAPAGKLSAHKPGWGQCPPADLPLRQTLPKFRPETERRLVRFGAGQNFLGGWLCDRAEAYFQGSGAHLNAGACLAVACLDLLTWQAGGLADKAALDRLPTDAELTWEKREVLA